MNLTVEDVTKQIQQMISFIHQEAAEKVEEIEVKTEEEFNIEKSRLVSQQRIKVNEFYDKKEKQVELQKKIQLSHLINKKNLSILQARDECVRSFKEEIQKNLCFSTKNRAKYITILADLITEGLLRLMEINVIIRCRHDDYGLVSRLVPDAIRRYQQCVKQKNINVFVDPDHFLSDDLAGGIELYAHEGKIKVINTLEARLDQIFYQMLPEIRGKLFGINQNRKYYD